MRRLLLAGLCVLSFCGFSLHAGELPVLKLGHVGHDHQIALYIAIEKGEALKPLTGGIWFRKQKDQQVYDLMDGESGLARIMLVKVRGGSGMPAALGSGEIEIGLGGVAPTVAAIDQGAPLKIIAPCNCDGDMLMVKPDMKVDNWKEFVELAKTSEMPVKIGYKAPRAVAYLIFIRALKEEGVTCGEVPVGEDGRKNQVVTVNLQGQKNMVPSLSAGTVDGFVMNQPLVAAAEEKKVGKVICDLRDLPPEGKWHNHPCCCVAACEKTLANKKDAVSALLKAMIVGGRLISSEQEQSIAAASLWTQKSVELESKSIPTVTYNIMPDKGWSEGMKTWFEMMNDLGQFTGKLKGKKTGEMPSLVSDYSLITAVEKELPKAETE